MLQAQKKEQSRFYSDLLDKRRTQQEKDWAECINMAGLSVLVSSEPDLSVH